MKTIFYVLFVVHISSLAAFATTPWQRLDADLARVRYFPQNDRVFCLGSNGCLLRSEDQGATWKQVVTNTDTYLLSIDFATSLVGTIVGVNSLILRTTDGGISWKQIVSPTQNYIGDVHFVSPTIGFACGSSGTVLKTFDAGLTWEKLNFPYSIPLNTIVMESPTNGFVAGYSSHILRTIDGGQVWEDVVISGMPPGSYHFIKSTRSNGSVFFIGNDTSGTKGVLVSSNDGITFTAHEIQASQDFYIIRDTIYTISSQGTGIQKANINTLVFGTIDVMDYTHIPKSKLIHSLCSINDSITIVVGERKMIRRSTDNAHSWHLLSYLYTGASGESFTNIQFVNDSVGYVCGTFQYVYHTRNGGATWLPQQANSEDLIWVNEVFFLDEKRGFGIISESSDGFISTNDGGITFTRKKLHVDLFPKIRFVNDKVGFITSNIYNPIKTNLLRTKDGGTSWTERPFLALLSDFRIVDSTIIFLCGTEFSTGQGRGICYISQDTGSTWDSVLLPSTKFLGGCWAMDAKNLFVVGGAANDSSSPLRIARSSDGGKTWQTVDSLGDYHAYRIKFSSNNLGYAFNNNLLQTKDGGSTWKILAPRSKFGVPDYSLMEVLPNGNVILGGADSIHGTLLRSNFENSVVSVKEAIIDTPIPSVWLYNPRPIPTSGKIRLDAVWLQVVDPSTITIILYDMLGTELKNITETFHPDAGKNTGIVEFDGGNLTSGIYYIEINGGGYRKAVPVIIAR